MAIENAKFGKGIALAGGFDLGAKAPLDSRLTVATIEERDAHVEGNRAYDGMLVFVEADKITYQYILGEDGTGEWKEFGFNEADFVAHVANDLATDDEAKALSAAQGVVLKGLIDGEIERAGEAEEGLQTAIDELSEYVGTIPADANVEDVIGYVNKKAQEVLDAATGGSSESAASVKLQLDNYISENNTKVNANTQAIEKAQGDVDALAQTHTTDKEALEAAIELKADKTALEAVSDVANAAAKATDLEAEVERATSEEARIEGLVTAETTRATGVEADFETRIAKMEVFWETTEDADGVVNKLKEIQDYIAGDETGAAEMAGNIQTNTQAIADMDAAYKLADQTLQGNIDKLAETVDTKASTETVDAIDERLETAEGKIEVIEGKVETLEGQMTEVQGAVATKAEAQDLTDAVTDINEAIEATNTEVAKKADATALATEIADREAADEQVLADAKAHAIEKIAEEATARDNAIAEAKAGAITEATTQAETKAKELDAALEETLKAYADSKVDGVDLTGIAKNAEDIVAIQEAMESKADVTTVNAAIEALEDEVAKIGTIEDGKTVVELLAEARAALDNADKQVEANAKAHAEAEDAKVLEAAKADATEKANAVKDIIGDVEEGKTVMQLLAEARAAAEKTAKDYTDAEIKKVSDAVTALTETHNTDKEALSAKDAEIAGNVSGLQDRIVALEAIEHQEISTEEINAMFPTEA